MKAWMIASVALTGIAMSAPASAAKYIFTMSGKVRSVEVSQQTASGVIYRKDIESQIAAGNTFRLSAVLDSTKFGPGPLNTEISQIFYGSFSKIDVEAGAFDYSAYNAALNFTTLELNSDLTPSWGARQALSGLLDPGKNATPVDLGTGQTNLFYTFNAIGGLPNTSYIPDINNLYSLDQYKTLGGAFGFYNSSLQLQALYTLSDFKASLTTMSVVPEPATWAMLLVGFGMIGATARNRRRSTKFNLV